MAPPVRTTFFGSGAFALPILAELSRSELVRLVSVVTAPPRPAGRKGELKPTPVADAAATAGTLVHTPTSLRDAATLELLQRDEPGLIVLADYGRIVPADVLALPAHGALNLHPSLLPRHRGASPVPAAILAGDAHTGVTLMRMDEGLDTGPLVAQETVALSGDETAPDLEAELARRGAALMARSLEGWLDGSLEAVPQPDEGATLTKPLRRADGRLDPTRGAAALERQVRALQPWPGSFIEGDGERLIVWAAEVAPSVEGDDVGSVVHDGDGIALATADGRLRLTEVQPAGKRRMSGADYRRGRRA